MAVLLAVEMVADKVPVVDHINDVVQTVVRPTAGGLAFGAGSSSETVTVSDPGSFFSSHQWVPVVTGVLLALGVHLLKSAARPVINATTAGIGAPVASTAEDATSVVVSLVAIILPVLVLVVLVGLAFFIFWFFRRRSDDAANGRPPAPPASASDVRIGGPLYRAFRGRQKPRIGART